MIFKDRRIAGRELGLLLKNHKPEFDKKNTVIVSLLRGGFPVGYEAAKVLHSPHIPIVVAKISAPENPELAIGAVCFDITYLDPAMIRHIGNIPKSLLRTYITVAKYKFDDYMDRFILRKTNYPAELRNKTVIIVDDGVATGASVKAAYLYITTLKPKKIIIASPVVLGSLDIRGIPVISFRHEKQFGSISRFYESFQQVEDEEILKLLRFS